MIPVVVQLRLLYPMPPGLQEPAGENVGAHVPQEGKPGAAEEKAFAGKRAENEKKD